MNRVKDILCAVAPIIAVMTLLYLLAAIPKAHGQSNEDKLFARHDSLFVKLQDGREFFAGETQKDGDGYFSIFPERAYHIVDSIKTMIIESSISDTTMYFTKFVGTLEPSPFLSVLNDTLFVRLGYESFALAVKVNGNFHFPLHTNNSPRYGFITDSIKWVPSDTTFEGDKCHAHDWVYSEPSAITFRVGDMIYKKHPYDPSLGRLLACVGGYHPRKSRCADDLPIHDEEEHCPYEVLEREKICRTCMRSVVERERWFQHYVAPPKTEFQKLKEKQRVKP